ncbi:diguanylate cyclase/phosphodiesterase with PAS/PAC sensor(s) [Thiorhodococcus drewsii AZ1]|uniref:cyclic-guanylate-specific phosphodiesterase n=1 Tax=Thiorhodococcus drewsii AZ1 TaxID=765913 RepID=G2E3C3_9GAMM|nr:EAL domain-containing protein [Thiorhodococcus drewsii]EGV30312.1 diguanylate cyclase/phosphodiesterase with PAS/PAC sensor(s) [Thiorhodococcus drewsii AZ1]
MLKLSELDDELLWELQRNRIIGLGERSFRKNYYPQLRCSLSRLERFRALLDCAGEMILLVALPSGQVIDANAAAAELLDLPLDGVIGQRLDVLGFSHAEVILAELVGEQASGGSPSLHHEVALQAGDAPRHLDLVCRAADLDGVLYGVLLGRDATRRVAAESRLRLAARVFADSAEGILVGDRRGRVVEINHAFEAITGYARDEVMGWPMHAFVSSRHDPGFFRSARQALKADNSWQGELWSQRKNREIYPLWLSLSLIRDHRGRVQNFVAMFSDISERKENEARIQHMAHHDFLTGLPNRFLLIDRLTQLLATARRDGRRFAVLFIDLDRFKTINDSLGHRVGDRLLCAIGERLRGRLRTSDTVARQGGDEFIVLLSYIEGPTEVVRVCNMLLSALSEPCLFEGHELSVTPSIGVAIGPDDGTDSDTLLKHADLAMYQVKRRGRNDFEFFRNEMRVHVTTLLQLERDLRHAVERDELEVFYQPQMDLRRGGLAAVEALLRWHHPERGLVLPGDFIPLAEESRLIVPIGEWVLRTACRQLAAWRAGQWPELRLAVNLSPVQFQQAELIEVVRSALDDSGLDPEVLELEVTEGLLMDNRDLTLQALADLKAMGIRLSIDDFGTGYSSLVYLKRFPVGQLKIDRSFVRDLLEDRGDAAICETIIALAGHLDLEVVAEGVEQVEQLDWLREAGCDRAQGYLLGRPMSVDALERRLSGDAGLLSLGSA